MDLIVVFRYRLKTSRPKSIGGPAEISDSCEVTLTNVPAEVCNQEQIADHVVWQVEEAFLKQIENRHPFDDLVEWEALLSDGKIVSQFRATVP